MDSKKFIFFIIILSFTVFTLLLLTGCQKKASGNDLTDFTNLNGSSGNIGAGKEEMIFTYINNPERVEHNTYSIIKPKDWGETEYKSTMVYLPPGGDLKDTFSEKFSMIIAFFPENETLNLRAITDDAIAESKRSMPDLQVIELNDRMRLGQIDAIRLVLNARIENRTLVITQLRAIQGNRIYAFSQQCEQGLCAYSGMFDEMAQSFKWKNP